jgi:chromosomal replication initiation ATPase DnaA
MISVRANEAMTFFNGTSISDAPRSVRALRRQSMFYFGTRLSGMKLIEFLVENRYELKPGWLRKHNNEPRIVRPRQVAFYIARQMKFTFPAIGRHFGGFHHTTVCYGVVQVKERLQSDLELKEFVDSVIEQAL